MICKDFIHIGMGDTGEGVIRYALHQHVSHKVTWLDSRAHRSLKDARKYSDAPAFSFVRNPFDWYISFWIHELKTQRWRGTFASWLLGRHGKGVSMLEFWQHFSEPGIEYVGQFETLAEDFSEILSQLIPDIVTKADVLGWFPEAYKQWGHRPWIECIEQHMRDELYTPQLVDHVYIQDAPIFEEWGYRYEDRYLF
jgi:hypothetical protein